MAEQTTPPDRIDFFESPDGTIMRQCFQHPKKRRDIPLGQPKPLQDDYTLERALAWCEENGYFVYCWQYRSPFGGQVARAFLGVPWPIRTRDRMRELRQQLEALALAAMRSNPGKWHPVETLLQVDLAYCL